jgi:hypothetical protein
MLENGVWAEIKVGGGARRISMIVYKDDIAP